MDLFGGSGTWLEDGPASLEEGIARGGSKTSQKRGHLRRSRRSSRKSAVRGSWRAAPSAKSAESLVVAREADRWALLPRSPDVYMASRRSHDRDETLFRSYARVSRLTQTHGVARRATPRHVVLKLSHALLDDHILWDPIIRRFLNDHLLNMGVEF